MLERRSGRPSLPIMALTAHALPANHIRCLEVGMTMVMAKPVNFKQLEHAIGELCHRASVAESEEVAP